ncbi:hypothetical protein PsYK624_104850 [Phanerochaete sordida]|uniref:DUF6697 domain-containing protein n=1 Tax=Phanerochaete sordida TaxID=48140 RepID=A0A9P3LG88_9APHY|nr:hypothetical protein PsYK624_104850 [Phanerochaete sordida]
MDELSRDPELAPGLVRLLSEKLTETRKVLEDARQENKDLVGEIAQLRAQKADMWADAPGGRRSEDQSDVAHDLAQLRQDLAQKTTHVEELARENERMDSELDELRATIAQGSAESLEEHHKPLMSCLSQLCPARTDIRDLRQQVKELEDEIARTEVAVQEREVMFQAKLEKANAKRDKYKAKLEALKNAEKGPVESPKNADEDAQEACISKRSPMVVPSGRRRGDRQHLDQYKDQPCVDISYLPDSIPRTIEAHSKASRVLWYPECTIFSSTGGHDARIFVSKVVCSHKQHPLKWRGSKSTSNLTDMLGSKHELFVPTDSSCARYLGTYCCFTTSIISGNEWQKLPKEVRDGIVKRCVGKTDGTRESMSPAQTSAIHDACEAGDAEVRCFHLRFDSFNHGYFGALLQLKESRDRAISTKAVEKRKADEAKACDGPEYTEATKRARKK